MFHKYRILWVAYGIAFLAGAREFMVSRATGAPSGPGSCEASAASCSLTRGMDSREAEEFWREHAEIAAIVERINPDDPDTHFLKGMQALADGDEETFVHEFETALSSGAKHNHYLLQYYAQYLVDRAEDWQMVNRAVNLWRRNHQLSGETLSLRLGTGPRDDADAALLRRALSEVPWVADSRLERFTEDGVGRWRVHLSFVPGRPVDVREAVAAVTMLALPEEHRPHYEVQCSTLQDCTAVRRAP